MKVLGISGSNREDSTTKRLVEEVLSGVEGAETELISLKGKHIEPCRGCLGCVEDNVCVIKDDMAGLREKIIEADAFIIGAPNFFKLLNAQTHCFMERWYQFRHQARGILSSKLAAVVGVGGGDGQPVIDNIKTFLEYSQIECVGEVTATGPAPCFTCGYGEDCRVGAIHMFFGPGTKITDEITPSIDKQPEALKAARELGEKLSKRLKEKK